jgi:hypothetical protein
MKRNESFIAKRREKLENQMSPYKKGERARTLIGECLDGRMVWYQKRPTESDKIARVESHFYLT